MTVPKAEEIQASRAYKQYSVLSSNSLDAFVPRDYI